MNSIVDTRLTYPDTTESKIIVALANNILGGSKYGVKLNEAPYRSEPSSTVLVTCSCGGISSEVNGFPTDSSTFRCHYNSGHIITTSSHVGHTLTIKYQARGTILDSYILNPLVLTSGFNLYLTGLIKNTYVENPDYATPSLLWTTYLSSDTTGNTIQISSIEFNIGVKGDTTSHIYLNDTTGYSGADGFNNGPGTSETESSISSIIIPANVNYYRRVYTTPRVFYLPGWISLWNHCSTVGSSNDGSIGVMNIKLS